MQAVLYIYNSLPIIYPMLLFRFILCMLLLGTLKTSAQLAPQDSSTKKWEFDFLLDKRKSIFWRNNLLGTNATTSVTGINFGFTYRHKIRLGIGAFYAKSNGTSTLLISKAYYVSQIQNLAPKAVPISVNGQNGYLVNGVLTMYYVTPSIEYLFYTSKWLTLGIPLEIGMGYSNVNLTDFFTNVTIPIVNSSGKTFKINNYFFPALGGINAMLNLSPDVAFTASLGYRKILTQIGINQNFDGLYYQLGFRLLPKHIKQKLVADYKKYRVRN